MMTQQTEADKTTDRFLAAMETGNHAHARLVIKEAEEMHGEALAVTLRVLGIKDYGVVL